MIWGRHSIGRLAIVVGPVVLVAVAGFAVGGIFVHRTLDGIELAAVIALAIVMLDRPVTVSILAMCAVFVVQRAGGSSAAAGSAGGIAYTDLLLAGATLFALPMILRTGTLERLRLALVGVAIYLALLLPTLLLHPSHTAEFEWAHRFVMIGGSLLVGASIAQARAITAAMRVLVGIAVVYAILAILSSARTGFSDPASPLGLNKNFVGTMLGTVAALVLCAPGPLKLPRALRYVAIGLLGAGLLTSQSRGAMLAAAIAVYAAALLSGQVIGRARKIVAVLLAAALTYGAYVSVSRQFSESANQQKLNSIGVRFSVERATQRIWLTSPVSGVGLKYFRTGNFGYFAQPANNVIDNELAESGVVGAIGFVTMEGLILASGIRRRRDGQLVVAATGLVLAGLMHGMIDIYWTAGIQLPFIVLGMALGEVPRSPETSDGPTDAAAASRRSATTATN